MKATRIDKDGLIRAALGAAGYKINEVQIEVILNLANYVQENPNATLKDVLRKEQCALALFEEDDLSKKNKKEKDK